MAVVLFKNGTTNEHRDGDPIVVDEYAYLHYLDTGEWRLTEKRVYKRPPRKKKEKPPVDLEKLKEKATALEALQNEKSEE